MRDMSNKIKTLGMVILILGVLTINAMAESNTDVASHRPNNKVDATTYGSYNWAGYAVHTGTYTSVNGTWVVPTIQTGYSGYSSAWVGIGGFSGNTVIQIGTEQDCSASSVTGGADKGEKKYHEADDSNNKVNAIVDKPSTNSRASKSTTTTSCTPHYYAWWEMYPQNAEQPISGLKITPGDSITASVIQNGDSSWTLTITDSKSGTFSITQKPNFIPDLGSAETIMERPALCSAFSCKLTNLADFGTINFNSVSSNNGLFGSSADGIIMFDSRFRQMAYPTPITTPGVFSVQWVRNS
jgi:hypothetical protein